MKLHGLVALVTGANRGIGRAIALRLAKDGATVGVHYGHDQATAKEVIQLITSTGGTAFPVQAELDTLKGVYALYDALDASLIKQTGTAQFDILVNNAGIYPRATIENTTEELFDQQFAINVKAPFFLMQQALPRLRDGGRIINLSSAVTRVAAPNLAAYSLTKGAINTLTQTLAAQLGSRGITVNAVAPSATDTDTNASWLRQPESQQMITNATALGRVGKAEDIADVVAFFASPDSRWVTGQYVEASGGFRL